MTTAIPPLRVRRNSQGSLVGAATDGSPVWRVAAHLYEISSTSEPGLVYWCYVESLRPGVYRCMCMGFLVAGRCSHGAVCLALERGLKAEYPTVYRQERTRQQANRKRGLTLHPWMAGSKQ